MKQQVTETRTQEKCKAVVTFQNGMGFTRTTQWHDRSHGFDGGHWGIYPHLRDEVTKEIQKMQTVYGAPGATAVFYRMTRKVVFLEQVFDSESRYAERIVEVQP